MGERITIGIIGTAGRDEQLRAKMTRVLYFAMYRAAKELLEKHAKGYDILRLVSGGAAWSDHLAVNLFNKKQAEELLLHFPTEFADQGFRAIPGDSRSGRTARTANWYHSLFSTAIRHDSINDIRGALEEEGCDYTVSAGFHARNRLIAKDAQVLIAFTWAEGNEPSDGGTRHTWECSELPTEQKIHVSLRTLSAKA